MDDRKGVSGWLAVVSIALITAFALFALGAAHREQAPRAVVEAPPPRPVMPLVQVWLSTADRRLRLARQPDIEMTARAALPGDVVIDTHATYQSMVGFGAALTDASAWLMQNRMSEAQRTALLREMFGPPPGLNMSMTRLTIGASDFSLQPYTLDDLPPGETDPSLAHFNVTPNLR